ncbi:hypothetical protein [Stappia sp. ES.058]|uniref:hypothetical protein n=1 Tax=Stappia sp. ES.058 TaxID=1881061 RepID=UPI00087B5C16|nr:hypothetical protein [Stappia sp. ES.058]SDU29659.1 hypothetical protein SAMN05428979_2809 [Stappia sp. ES.058]
MSEKQSVTITDVDIPFVRLMMIIIKVSLAAIPAAIVVSLVLGLIMSLLAGVFGGLGMMGPWMHGGRPL